MQKAIQILSVLLILHFAAVTQSIVSLSQSNVAILQLSEANTKSCYPLPQSFTALAIWLMCAGVVPQQPPTIFTNPSFAQSSIKCAV